MHRCRRDRPRLRPRVQPHRETEEPPKRRTLPEPNLDPTFPEIKTKKCPIDKYTFKHTRAENDEYVRWILKLFPRLHVRDESVYCSYCDREESPSMDTQIFGLTLLRTAQAFTQFAYRRLPSLSLSSCKAGWRACNPNCAIYEKKQTRNQNRVPNYDLPQQPVPPPPPPAQESSTSPMDTVGPLAHHDAAPAEAAPLCAEAAAMHPQPNISSPAQRLLQQHAQWGPASRCIHLLKAVCRQRWDTAQACQQNIGWHHPRSLSQKSIYARSWSLRIGQSVESFPS